MSAPETVAAPPLTSTSSLDELRNQLPVRYYDSRLYSVLYTVDLRDADTELRGYPVSAVRLPLSTALLTLTWFHYPDTTIGPYDEFSVAILASSRPRDRKLQILRALTGGSDIAGLVLHLPVTSELAHVGGRELFGFPKSVAEITLVEGSSALRAELAEGQPVLRMGIPWSRGQAVRFSELSTFSVLRGNLLRTRVPLRGGRAKLMSARGTSLELLAPHVPVAQTIGRLVGRRRPWGILAVRGYTAELGIPSVDEHTG